MDAPRLAVGALLVAVGLAGAHPAALPKADRLLIDRRVTLTIDYRVAGDVARTLRRIVGDDRRRLARHLAREATAFLELTVDGQRRRPEITAASVGLDDDSIGVQIELRCGAPLGPGAHTLILADRHKDRRISVPVTIVLGPQMHFTRPPPFPAFVDAGHRLELAVEAR